MSKFTLFFFISTALLVSSCSVSTVSYNPGYTSYSSTRYVGYRPNYWAYRTRYYPGYRYRYGPRYSRRAYYGRSAYRYRSYRATTFRRGYRRR